MHCLELGTINKSKVACTVIILLPGPRVTSYRLVVEENCRIHMVIETTTLQQKPSLWCSWLSRRAVMDTYHLKASGSIPLGEILHQSQTGPLLFFFFSSRSRWGIQTLESPLSLVVWCLSHVWEAAVLQCDIDEAFFLAHVYSVVRIDEFLNSTFLSVQLSINAGD